MFDLFKRREDRQPVDTDSRLPPGQYVTEKFPVLHYGNVPHYTNVEQEWDLRVWGSLAAPACFSFAQLRKLPTVAITVDIHCVTSWSKFDTAWEGVQFREFLRHLPPLHAEARFVLAHAEGGYAANLPLEVLLEDDVLLAYLYDGKELEPDHGYPLRLVVPKKYFWKSAKWLRGIEFLPEDKHGFWERYGYHNHADPWREERYAE